jgi:hypothetical protein
MNDAADMAAILSSHLSGAAVDLVQSQRAPWQALASCEAIAKGGSTKSDRLAFSGTQIAFGSEEKDARRAFERLDRDLAEAAGASPAILATNIYAPMAGAADLVRKLRPSTGAMTILPCDGVAAMDAGFAVDAVAAVSK